MSDRMIERIRRTRAFERTRASGSPAAGWLWLRFRAGLHYLRRGHLARRRIVSRYRSMTPSPRLHVGAGNERMDGWLDSDLVAGDIYLDLSRPLPLPDSSFQHVFGEHVVEHIGEREGEALLRELRRIVVPGGVVRITTPDLKKIIALYEDRNPEIGLDEYAEFLDGITGKSHERAAQVFNDFMRQWGHVYVYDEEDLTAKLEAAGFVAIARCEPGGSDHDLLRGIERHGPPWENRAEAMCIEASVPR